MDRIFVRNQVVKTEIPISRVIIHTVPVQFHPNFPEASRNAMLIALAEGEQDVKVLEDASSPSSSVSYLPLFSAPDLAREALDLLVKAGKSPESNAGNQSWPFNIQELPKILNLVPTMDTRLQIIINPTLDSQGRVVRKEKSEIHADNPHLLRDVVLDNAKAQILAQTF